MSNQDPSTFYSAGAEAMKRLAARCGHGRLARIFEDQARRYQRMAETSARQAAARPPAVHIVRAQRPRAVHRMTHFPHMSHLQRPTNGADTPHHAARERHEG